MAYENLRAFIPSGHCVPPPPNVETPGNAHEAFQETDHGFANELLLRVAQEACLSCIQRPWCEEQRDPIAGELWRVGVKRPMIAAERVDAGEPSYPMVELVSTKLQFDLSELPTDQPERFLSLLRQGVRAKQLSIMAHRSPNLSVISHEYQGLLGARHPETLDKLNTTLTKHERERAYRYISQVLCQQGDFKGPAGNKRRYRPENHDFETCYPTVRLYMEEAVAVKSKGYRNPGQMAMHYDLEYCDNLLKRFGEDVILRSHFFRLVLSNINEPVTALTAFLARVQSHRVAGGGTVSNIQHRAWTKKQAIGSPSVSRKRAELQAAHATASPAAIEDALAKSKDPDLRIQTVKGRVDRLVEIYGKDHRIVRPHIMKHYAENYADYKNETEDYIDRFKALERVYTGDPDFKPHIFVWIASKYKDSLKEAGEYKKRLKLYRDWAAASDYKVTDIYLQECARRDFDSYEEIIKLKIVLRLRGRFKERRRQDETQPVVDKWMLNRIAALCPPEEMDEVGEGLYQLLSMGILTGSVAELKILQDPFAVFDANEVADPRAKKYLTFSAMLQDLTSEERLMIARHYNLIPLLYGRLFSRERVDLFLGIKESSGALVALPSIAAETSEKYTQEAYDLVTIVGAGLVQVPQVELNEQRLQGAISDDQKQWLQRSINGNYPPAERRQKIKEIESALCAGRVVVRGNATTTYQLALADSFYTAGLSDLERAVIAQVSGVDRLLYGQDVSLMLKYRLDTADLVEYLITDILPRIGSWKSIEAAAAELQLEESDIQDIAREEIQGSQVWYARGRIIAISSDAVASFGDIQRTAAAKKAGEPELDQPVEPKPEPESEPEIQPVPDEPEVPEPDESDEPMEPEPKGDQPDVVIHPSVFSDEPGLGQGHRVPDFSDAPSFSDSDVPAKRTLDPEEIGRAILATRPSKPSQLPTSAPALHSSAEMPGPGALQQPWGQNVHYEYKEIYGRLHELGVPCSPGVIGIVMQDCNLRHALIQEATDGHHVAVEATIQRLAGQIRRYPLATPELETPQALAGRLGVRLPDVVRASREVNITNMRTVSGLYRSVDEHGHPRPLAMYYKPLLIKLIERRIPAR